MAYPPYPPADPNGQPSSPQQPPAGQPYPPYYPPSPADATAPPSQPYYPYPQPTAAPPSQPYYQQPTTGSPGYPYYQQPPLATPQKPNRSPLLILLAVVVLVAIAGGGWYFLSHRTANIAGTWNMTLTYVSPSTRVDDDHLNIQQSGDQLTVVVTLADPNAGVEPLTLTGHVSGSDVEFDYAFQGCSLRMPGTASDSNHMAGSWTTTCGVGSSQTTTTGTWSAVRTDS